MRRFACLLLLLLLTASGRAQDVALLAGQMKVVEQGLRSFGVSLDANYRLGDYGGLSAAYINEGHPDGHHRDGLAGQLWWHSVIPQQGASIAVGIGPYYYFDTRYGGGSGLDYHNDHGWGSIASLGLKWHLRARSYVELRASRIRAHGDHDSNLVLVGMGYELRDTPPSTETRNAAGGDDVLSVLAGQAIVNSFASERSRASSLEYRRILTPNVELSVAWLADGVTGERGRRGVSSQLWLVRPLTERSVLELGAGAYALRDGLDRDRDIRRTHLVPVASFGVRYRISLPWRAQLTWTRVITHYHRDADVLLAGVGYVF